MKSTVQAWHASSKWASERAKKPPHLISVDDLSTTLLTLLLYIYVTPTAPRVSK